VLLPLFVINACNVERDVRRRFADLAILTDELQIATAPHCRSVRLRSHVYTSVQ